MNNAARRKELLKNVWEYVTMNDLSLSNLQGWNLGKPSLNVYHQLLVINLNILKRLVWSLFQRGEGLILEIVIIVFFVIRHLQYIIFS